MHGQLQQVEIQTPSSKHKEKKGDNFFIELIKFALIAIVIVIPIRLYVAQPFIVSGSSMDPTFENGEYLIVDELSYRFEEPERGDVVIFRYPRNPSKFFIKRVIGLPSETVTIESGSVHIVNQEYPDGIELTEPYVNRSSRENFTLALADDEYFVLGDNRPASSDSRVWGALERDLIVGRALIRLLPVNKISFNPGETSNQIQVIENE